jgi:hypothetical protein
LVYPGEQSASAPILPSAKCRHARQLVAWCWALRVCKSGKNSPVPLIPRDCWPQGGSSLLRSGGIKFPSPSVARDVGCRRSVRHSTGVPEPDSSIAVLLRRINRQNPCICCVFLRGTCPGALPGVPAARLNGGTKRIGADFALGEVPACQATCSMVLGAARLQIGEK